jgi:hypothetical protein
MIETIKNVLAYLDEILVTLVLKGYFTAKFQEGECSRMHLENFDLQDIEFLLLATTTDGYKRNHHDSL